MTRALSLLLLSLLASPSSARGDVPRPRPDEAALGLDASVDALSGCLAEDAVIALGERWEATLAAADWDPHAPGPRDFAERVAPPLREAFLSRRTPRDARSLALELLASLEHAVAEPLFLRMLETRTCPAPWIVLAAGGLAKLATDRGRVAIADALVASVPEGRPPEDAAWSLCAATARDGGDTIRDDVAEAVRRLFLFAPQIAVETCMPLVMRLPDAAALAERVLDGRDWPEPVGEADPREPRMLGPYARGAALILLGQLHAEGAYERLARALDDRSFEAQPTRDGAVQGLAALAGPRARALLRGALRDGGLRTPRIAHALLRLGDVPSAEALREAALDESAIVEMRVSAANAYTLLAPGRHGLARGWERDLGRTPPLGPPFEALDARIREMTARLVAAERCRAGSACWAELAWSDDPQQAARALWELSRAPITDDVEAAPMLAETAARVIADTPPNEQHDRVSGAIALLARLEPGLGRPYLPVVRRARAAWEGRTNPMGLPFDIPLALGQLERRLAAPAAEP